MVTQFRRLVALERPDYIISFDTVKGTELSCVFVKYKKSDKFYIAVSFFTHAWISKNPIVKQSYVPVFSLSDVANIIEFREYKECLESDIPTESYIRNIESTVKAEFIEQFRDTLPKCDGYKFEYSLSLAPVPILTAKASLNNTIIGTLLVEYGGALKCVQSFSEEFTMFISNRKEQLQSMQLISNNGRKAISNTGRVYQDTES